MQDEWKNIREMEVPIIGRDTDDHELQNSEGMSHTLFYGAVV